MTDIFLFFFYCSSIAVSIQTRVFIGNRVEGVVKNEFEWGPWSFFLREDSGDRVEPIESKRGWCQRTRKLSGVEDWLGEVGEGCCKKVWCSEGNV